MVSLSEIDDILDLDTLPSGRWAGTKITRVPVSYLKWMVNSGYMAEQAQEELDRRGTVIPELEVSGHAVDRASQRCLKVWRKERKEDEGLHHWLVRMSMEAINVHGLKEKIHYKGLKMVFTVDNKWPTLKTVMPRKQKR